MRELVVQGVIACVGRGWWWWVVCVLGVGEWGWGGRRAWGVGGSAGATLPEEFHGFVVRLNAPSLDKSKVENASDVNV